MHQFYLLGNYTLTMGFLSWVVAQILKVLINLIKTKEFRWERLVGAGGMPSSHSALVSAMTVGVAKTDGMQSATFAVTCLMAAVVMYDAMGVRRAAGEQAKVLNRFISQNEGKGPQTYMVKRKRYRLWRKRKDGRVEVIKLKEFLGHTPLEVVCGATLGIILALIIPAPGV